MSVCTCVYMYVLRTYVCMYICTYVYMYVCIYMYVLCTYVCMYVCNYLCMYMLVCTHICVYACQYVRTYVCMYVYVCMDMYVRMCVYVRMSLCVFVQGWTNSARHVVVTTKLCAVPPGICGSSVLNFLHILFLHLDFWKICAPLHILHNVVYIIGICH
jgi:hypothetical protein